MSRDCTVGLRLWPEIGGGSERSSVQQDAVTQQAEPGVVACGRGEEFGEAADMARESGQFSAGGREFLQQPGVVGRATLAKAVQRPAPFTT